MFVQYLMSSCLNLSRLWADVVDVGNMGKGSWVCYRMTELDLSLYLQASQSAEKDIHAIYMQLANLKELRVLRLGEQEQAYEGCASTCLDFTLKQGLGQLKSLAELRDLDLYRLHPRMGHDEATWIQGHWPQLRKMTGNFHPDETQRRQVTEHLSKEKPEIVVTKIV
ncbi:MAG: hypothetical protein BYD32DRAFT_432620 [Podila humilis]|nr:MAG: hypothetical protein BYD32DRAFT_432620 [Podila humilis]